MPGGPVGAQHVAQRERVHHGFDVVEVEGFHVGCMIKDGGELAGEAFKVGGVKVEAGKAGNVRHVVS